MRFFHTLLAGVLLWVLPFLSQGQTNIPLGTWRSHLPHTGSRLVAQAGTRIYCASEFGLFFLDRDDNRMQTLSKVEGFSDVGVQWMEYDPETQVLLVAYRSANLDLVYPDGRIVNINDIQRKSITGSKTINHIYFSKGHAYISTDFGVVVLDVKKQEIKDTYQDLKQGTGSVRVLAATTLNDSIYLATSAGVMHAALVKRNGTTVTETNLLDFNNWHVFDPATSGLPTGQARSVATFQDRVYAAYNSNGRLYAYTGTRWDTTLVQGNFRDLRTSASSLVITLNDRVIDLHANQDTSVIDNSLLKETNSAVKAPDGSYWVADFFSGLVHTRPNAAPEAFLPNGPYAIGVFDMSSFGDTIYVAAGGYSASYVQESIDKGFYQFANGEWKNFRPRLTPDTLVQDIVDIAFNPINKKLYLASHGYGVVEWQSATNYRIINGTNSPLVGARGAGRNPRFYVRIDGLEVDGEGTVWMTNRNEYEEEFHLFGLKTNGTWLKYRNPLPNGFNIDKLVIDDHGTKWILTNTNISQGLVVFNERNVGVQWKALGTSEKNGFLPDATVYCITKDKDGAIWAGTEKGVVVYIDPQQVFSATYPSYDPRPRIGGRFLLEAQVVNAIAVDGGNRKWIGTDQGLWLFDPTGTKELAHFTAQNSPLPADKVNAIAINHLTGEVFAGTDAGIVSYRSGATDTPAQNDCVGIFPNPVRPEFDGLVGISGLPANANVKITDLTGTLVYQMKAEGSTATWNLADYNGRKVRSGVYLVLSSAADGSESRICKIAVLER